MLRTLIAGVIMLASASLALADPITVTDLAGRTVTLEHPAQRILLVEARQIVALSLVAPDAAQRLVGWADNERFDEVLRSAYIQKFPALADLPDVTQDNSVSTELLLSTSPDLVILSGGSGITEEQAAVIAVLDQLGIPSIYIDFRADPWDNTIPSLTLLGEVMGTGDYAKRFIDFYTAHRNVIVDRVAAANPPRPSVFMFMQASATNVLMAPGKSNLGTFIEAAGGRNIGAGVVPGMFGALSPEYLLTQDPDILIGTGGQWFPPDQGITAGPGTSPQDLQAGIRTIMGAETIKELSLIKTGKIHALWHNYHNSPLNVLALEAIAKWVQPDLFADIDPQATLDEINRTYLPITFGNGSWGDYAPE